MESFVNYSIVFSVFSASFSRIGYTCKINRHSLEGRQLLLLLLCLPTHQGRSENITKTRLFKYTEHFANRKRKFSNKNADIFHISAQNIECEYSLEPPRRGGSNEYHQSMFSSRIKKNNICPCKPQFYYIKVGFKGIYII